MARQSTSTCKWKMGEGNMSQYEKQIAIFGYICGLITGSQIVLLIIALIRGW
jgi:hypothetical protein